MSRETIAAALEDAGVVAIIRMSDPSKVDKVFHALVEGGIRALEVTMTVPGAIEHIRRLAGSLPAGFVLGAGTVTDPETATRVVEAGATFIVSPVFRPAVVSATHAAGAVACPGCFSPSEILDAWEAGSEIVKVFPATSLGPTYLKDIHGPMPQVKLMPTGGVSIENAGDWIRAGAVAVGIGSALTDKAAIETGRYEVITDKARRLVANVRQARGAA